MVPAPARVDIRDILARKAIEIHFQPIVSGRQRSIVGVEALSRGRDCAGNLVSPAALFHSAAAQGVTLELDQVCRRVAVEQFVPLHRTNPKLVLFVNTHASTLAHDVENLDAFIAMLQHYQVDPRNVALEILEAESIDTALLRAAVDGYNRHGFLVVLDDVGVGYSNLDRIMLVKPDILKADRALVHDLHRDLRKQGVFKALVLLSERIGGWLVAEGVETRHDAVVALDLGVDMLQGFFFGRPQSPAAWDGFSASLAQATATAEYFRQYTLAQFATLQQQEQHRRTLVQQVAAYLAHTDQFALEQALRTCISPHPDVASACVLDGTGRQISDTVTNPQPFAAQKTIIFEPPARGTDHSLKEYFYFLTETNIDIYQTQPYVPLPSQRICITVSTTFHDRHNQLCVLCLHIDVPEPQPLAQL